MKNSSAQQPLSVLKRTILLDGVDEKNNPQGEGKTGLR